MYIITDVCNYLDGEILRIVLLSTHILLKMTLKKRQHQLLYQIAPGTLFRRNFSFLKNNFVIVSQIETERSYLKQYNLFNRGHLCFLMGPLTK